MLICVVPNFKNKLEMLQKISNLLERKELFDETKFEFLQAIIKLEIENLLSEDERNKIEEDIKMTPQAELTVKQIINEVNWKVLAKTEEKGMEIGMEKGIEKGKENTMLEVAKRFKNQIDLKELSEFTGISIEEIQNL